MRFVTQLGKQIKGVLSGFDRIRFRGTLRQLSHVHGVMAFLSFRNLLLKDYTTWSQALTTVVVDQGNALARKLGQPKVYYVNNAYESKEEVALRLAKQYHTPGKHPHGLIAVLSSVDPCRSLRIHRQAERKQLELRSDPVKCLHHYYYFQHPTYGLLNVRVQTWMPFTVHIVMNGREWLACQLRVAEQEFVQRDNCFTHLGDPRRAQQLMDQQLRINWSQLLDGLLAEVQPLLPRVFAPAVMNYYWSAQETEWATDIMFKQAADLKQLFPRLVQHSMVTHGAKDVLRFLGRTGSVAQQRTSDLALSTRHRPEGARVKYVINHNSVKYYDKQDSVLRIETTINNPRNLKVLRPKASEPATLAYQQLRKGVADLKRRSDVSQQCNQRLLDGLAAANLELQVADVLAPISKPARLDGKPVRALRPFAADDGKLLSIVAAGEFTLLGFRNRDLRSKLFSTKPKDAHEQKRRTAKVTRLIRLLRAHQLIKKVPKTHRYQLTTLGQTVTTTLATTKHVTTKQLNNLAA